MKNYIRSFSVNFPKWRCLLSLHTKLLAISTILILSVRLLWWFKIATLLKRSWFILALNHVLMRRAVENVRSPEALLQGLTCSRFTIVITLHMADLSCVPKPLTAVWISLKQVNFWFPIIVRNSSNCAGRLCVSTLS